ncbi:MAG: aldehyde dehydrogenase family protein [Myxococcales bacterium]|nr:aldehyde dehydrogenase family protein [Myxococcales bacterium]
MLDVVQPGTGQLVERLPLESREQATVRIQTAWDAHQRRAAQPLHERIHILSRTAALLETQRDSLAMRIATEGGKPLWDAQVEVNRALDGFQIALRELQHLHGHAVPMGMTAASEHRATMSWRDPIGVELAISAFNHPLNLAVHQIIPAVAVGTPVLFKPSPKTPLSGLHLLKCLHECGLKPEMAQAVLVDDSTLLELVADRRIAHVSFIGASRVGWEIRRRIADGTRICLEHGGIAPCIVDNDVQVERIIPALTKGAFYHAGQVCVSTQRIYVPGGRAAEVAQVLAAAASALVVGPATVATTEVGPLIRPESVQRVRAVVRDAMSQGATCLTGGDPLNEWYFAPTVLLNPPDSAAISQQEVFGPVVCVYDADNLDAAIHRANQTRYAFQASIFTNRVDHALQASRQLEASTVLINDHTAFRTDWMPFAGRGESGLGEGGIGYSMRELTESRTVIWKG